MTTIESDFKESGPSPLKKQKTEIYDEIDKDAVLDGDEDVEMDSDSGSEVDSIIDFEGDIHGKVRMNHLDDDLEHDECRRQLAIFHYQWEKGEGFEVDWSLFTYQGNPKPVVWKDIMTFSEERSDKFVKRLTLFPIDYHNQKTGEELELVKILNANFYVTYGQVLFVTFRAKDPSSSHPDPILYQTRLWNARGKISVELFRPRPTDEEIASVQVDPPNPRYFWGDE